MPNWAYVPYSLPLILSGIAALALGLYANAHRTMRGAFAFMWICIPAAEWCLAYAAEVSSSDVAAKVFWAKVEYLGIALGPVCWLFFTLSYTRRGTILARRRWVPLILIPVATVVLAFTNEAHHLIWRTTTLNTSGPFPALTYEYGTWFWIHTAFSYSVMLAGSALLLNGLAGTHHFYRRQRLALTVGILIPWIGNALYLARINPMPGLDLTPIAATATCVAVALALFSFRLLDLVPIARRAVLDSMNDAVIAIDHDNRILDLNKSARRITGTAGKAAIGLPVGQVLKNHKDLVERFADVREAQTEITRETASGTRYFELQITPLLDVIGEYSGRLITLHDITDGKHAQQEIQALNASLEARVLERTAELAAANREKEETLRREQSAYRDLTFLAEASRILANSLDEAATLSNLAQHIVPYLADGCMIHIVDEPGALRLRASKHIDPSKARLITAIEQRYPAQYGGQNGSRDLTREGEARFWPRVEEEDIAGMARDEQHLSMLKALEITSYMRVLIVGRQRTLGTFTLMRCHTGQEYSATSLALAQDLANRTALAVENAQLYLAAKRAIQVRDEFLTVASHELKTPLTSLLLASSALQKYARRGTVPALDYLARRLNILDEQGKRLDQLVGNLLDISRISAGRLELEPQAVDLTAVVRQIVEQFQEELAGAHCSVDLQLNGPVRGFWDPSRIEQVVVNLLTNAMKYGKGGTITIGVWPEGANAKLVVSDEGIGIEAQDFERIFDRFERAVAPGKYSGMGMGLYITRQIVEAHGGRINVASTPDQGATFTVSLPTLQD